MPATLSEYNFTQNFYSFSVNGNCFVIEERNKNSVPRQRLTQAIQQLTERFTQVAQNHPSIAEEQAKKLHEFIEALKGKIRLIITNRHPYIGTLILIFEKLFRIGATGQLVSMQIQLNTLAKNPNALLQIEMINIEQRDKKVAEEAFERQHTDLRSLFGIVHAPNVTELKKQITMALEKPDCMQLLQKNRVSDVSWSIILESLALSTLYAKEFRRFEQIRSARFETVSLPDSELLRIAFFVESIFGSKKKFEPFCRREDTQLLRHLQMDTKKQNIYILAEAQYSVLKDDGDSTFKQLMACARLPKKNREKNPEVAACLLTKIKGLDVKTILNDVQNTMREVEFCKRFVGVRGLAQFQTSAMLSEIVAGKGEVSRMSLIFTRAHGNLYNRVYKDADPISLNEQITIAKDLLHGLKFMHQKKISHADLKLQNALFKKDASGKILAAELCDFGFCFEINEEQPDRIEPPEVYSFGHGGTASCTAPELYGNTKFKGNYFALDLWGLGSMLYQLHHRAVPPWKADIDQHTKDNFDDIEKEYRDKKALRKNQGIVQQKITTIIEENLKALESISQPSKEHKFRTTIYHMLHAAPEKRPTAELAYQEIEKLLNN